MANQSAKSAASDIQPREDRSSCNTASHVLPVPDLDTTEPPVGGKASNPLHFRAGVELSRMLHSQVSVPLPLHISTLSGHTPSTIYYGNNKVFFQMYNGLPQLRMYSMAQLHHIPVDQELVRVAREGEHLVFFIRIQADNIHALFRPFISAGSTTRPLQATATQAPASTVRHLLRYKQLSRATSMLPTGQNPDICVESHAQFRDEIFENVAKLQHSPNHSVIVSLPDIVSSNTGISQYLGTPIINWSQLHNPPSALHLVLRPEVPSTSLADEHDAWACVHLLLLASDISDVMSYMVTATTVDGKLMFDALVKCFQEAVNLPVTPLQQLFLQKLCIAFTSKQDLRRQVLGYLRPSCIFDCLISPSLVCPGFFLSQ